MPVILIKIGLHTKYLVQNVNKFFFNHPLLIVDDDKHSQSEERYFALGKTNAKRKLFVCFTVRHHLIRVISARDMTRNEKRSYSLL